MYYTYLTHSDGEYGFGVCSQLLNKKLPEGLCYFEVFADKKDAKSRMECLKKLSYAKLFQTLHATFCIFYVGKHLKIAKSIRQFFIKKRGAYAKAVFPITMC